MRYQVYELRVLAGDENGEYLKDAFFKSCEIELSMWPSEEEIIDKLVSEGYDTLPSANIKIENHDCCGNYYELVNGGNGYPVLDLKRIGL